MDQTWRGYLFALCAAVLLVATGWSAVVAADGMREQATRSLAVGGVGLCSLLAGWAAAQAIRPWLKARAPGGPTRLTR